MAYFRAVMIRFCATILLLGCSLNNLWGSSAELQIRPKLKMVFIDLKSMKLDRAEKYLLENGLKKEEKSTRKFIKFVGRLDQDSVHIYLIKRKRKGPAFAFKIELVRPNTNWYRVKNNIYDMEFEIKSWVQKSPIYRITQGPRDCLGDELNCLKHGKMEYKISWLWYDDLERENSINLFLNEEGNTIISFARSKG